MFLVTMKVAFARHRSIFQWCGVDMHHAIFADQRHAGSRRRITGAKVYRSSQIRVNLSTREF